jgi:hypothetical protein
MPPTIPPCKKCGGTDFYSIPDCLAFFCENCGFVWVNVGPGKYEEGPSIRSWLKDKELKKMKAMTNYLHIYAQPFEHQEAFILGDKEALTNLRNAIDKALTNGNNESSCQFYTTDGEGYQVLVLCREMTDNVALPYTAEDYAERRQDSISPYKLCKNYKALMAQNES